MINFLGFLTASSNSEQCGTHSGVPDQEGDSPNLEPQSSAEDCA